MITNKIEKLEQMANFEGDVRDGNIGDFSQGVVVGERNASKLALEVLEEITETNLMKRKKPPYFPSPIKPINMEYGVVCQEEANKIRNFRAIRDLIIIVILVIILLAYQQFS